jgi:hypothetical protein
MLLKLIPKPSSDWPFRVFSAAFCSVFPLFLWEWEEVVERHNLYLSLLRSSLRNVVARRLWGSFCASRVLLFFFPCVCLSCLSPLFFSWLVFRFSMCVQMLAESSSALLSAMSRIWHRWSFFGIENNTSLS